MSAEEIRELQRRIKFCMKRRVPVSFGSGRFYVTVMNLRYSERDGFFYTVELTDVNRLNSTITVGLDDIEWPTEGGGYKIE